MTEDTQPDPTTETAALPAGGAPPGGALPPGGGGGPGGGGASDGGGGPSGGGPGDGAGSAGGSGRSGGWRRITRSRQDRVLGGVCGGIAREYGVDPFVVRAVAVGLTLLAGLGLFLYVGALVLLPDEEGASLGTTDSTTGRLWTAVGVVALVAAAAVLLSGAVLGAIGVLVPLAAIAAAGLLVWWFVSGDVLAGGPGAIAKHALLGLAVLAGCGVLFVAGVWATGIGSGTVAAVLVIVAGLALVAGAAVKPIRWAVPLAFSLALGTGVAAAADLDLSGGAGERTYRPSAAADLRSSYELGAGRLVVDLRDTALPPGDVPLAVRVGLGQARIIVPRNACVAARGQVGAGAIEVLGRDSGGVDVDWQDEPAAAPGRTRVVVDGEVGMGVLQVSYRDDDPRHGGDRWNGDGWDDGWDGGGRVARADRAQAARACEPAGPGA